MSMVCNVLEYIENSAKQFPDKKAVGSGEEGLTYSQLVERIYSIGSVLIKRLNNISKRPIVVFMDKSPECFACFFGVVASGNFYVCIDDEMVTERIKNIFNTLEPVAIIRKRDKELPCTSNCPEFIYEELIKELCDMKLLLSVRDQVIDTDPVYVLYTSGSTGIPKGSVISHKSIIAYTEFIVETFDLDYSVVFGSQTPFYFSMSVLDVFSTVKCGGTLEIIPKKLFSFPVRLLEYMVEKRITIIYWVPSALSIVANWKALDYVKLPSLKTVLFAGEVMPTKQLNIWRKAMPDVLYANLFGPTEITDTALYYILDRDFSDEEAIPIGRHSKNMDCFAIKENGELISDDEIGELYFRGSFVGCGYYGMFEKTAEVFVQNPLNTKYPEIVYKTGDLVRLNKNGEYEYVGRKDFQIKHMGYRIELGEIEVACGAHKEVEACACLYNSQKDEIWLFYQGGIEVADLEKHLNQYLPSYMHPSKINKLESMPYNSNGKIDRLLLKSDF